jgi:hypothetical protein
MQLKFSLLLVCLVLASFSNAQSSMSQWNHLLEKEELVAYFSGVFEQLGITIAETGEKFTVIHKGNHFLLLEGVEEQTVDYHVQLKLENISNMVNHGADDKIDEQESFQIMSVLFTPFTEASLQHPNLRTPSLVRLSGLDNHMHVNLISPSKKDTVSHTLIYINNNWIVISGLHGDAQRVFNLTQADALEYQRRIFSAKKENTLSAWRNFRKWYKKWREEVAVKP